MKNSFILPVFYQALMGPGEKGCKKVVICVSRVFQTQFLPSPMRLGLVSRLHPWLRGILLRLSAGVVEADAVTRGIRP